MLCGMVWESCCTPLHRHATAAPRKTGVYLSLPPSLRQFWETKAPSIVCSTRLSGLLVAERLLREAGPSLPHRPRVTGQRSPVLATASHCTALRVITRRTQGPYVWCCWRTNRQSPIRGCIPPPSAKAAVRGMPRVPCLRL